jgi:hypothetical protein
MISPYHPIAPDPVVGLTPEAPISDRRVERHGIAIEEQSPTRRSEGCDYFETATAAAPMHSCSERNGDVQLAACHLPGKEFNELEGES